MIYTTQEELDAGLAKWQKRLRLQDWTVSVELQPSHVIGGGRAGVCTATICSATAAIQILCAQDDTKASNVVAMDHEITLVHELLHLHYEAFKPKDADSLEYILWERCIEQVSRVIVTLDRGSHVPVVNPPFTGS